MTCKHTSGRAVKGSRFWVQTIINSSMRVDLDEKIGLGPIIWLSPLREEGYKNYALNEEAFYERLGLPKTDVAYWTENQPIWDAVGLAGDTLILVEARSQIEESERRMLFPEKNEGLKGMLWELLDIMNHLGNGQFQDWIYQREIFVHRMEFLEKLNQLCHKKAKLILLNIVEDPTDKSISDQEWKAYTKAKFQAATGEEDTPKSMVVVNFQV